MGKNFSIAIVSLLLLLTSTNAGQVFDVKSYGAQTNGDITQALTQAWKAACAVAGSKVMISTGTYKLGLVTLLGPCKGAIEFNLQGTLQAPSDIESFKGKDGWVVFESIDNLTVSGGGIFDGQGQMAWQKNNCAKKYNCDILPINVRFNFITNSIVQDITSKDSKFFHINLLGCKNLQFQHVTITAPGDNSNTDGIHVGRSSQINITNADIGTGDDCISIGDGTQDITIKQVTCGPGHGISIGRVRVIGATLSNTNNGNVIMDNVGNPVLIDQNYCPNNQCSNESPSKVKISNVSFKNITGTSSTLEAVKLVCSKSVPCQQVVVADIDLAYKGSGSTTSTCVNVQPAVSGKQNPPICTKKI
ncbi:hypothetical protein RGQ29_018687 [Quercus rubra]|uniref:Polygalacturonase n=1 Tax=Quercus rubra TaxID=3512 RepID=A0AAN7FJL2_QUERU|nr:hypothetical protein RGQ29_018687 [Quercus rubra]